MQNPLALTLSPCNWGSLAFSAACCLVVAGGGCSKPTAAEASKNKLVAVNAVAVQQTAIDKETVQPASVHAYYRAEIRSRVSGYAASVPADIGDYVEAGAELMSISVPEMEQQREIQLSHIQRLVAEELRAKAGIRLAQAQVESAQAKLEEAKAQVASVEALVAATTAEFERTEDLVQRRAVQDRLLDEARQRRDSELARQAAVSSSVLSAEAEVLVTKAQLTSSQADLQAAEADTELAKNELKEIEVRMSYATIIAPFSGVVTSRHVELGDLVSESTSDMNKPLFVLSQVDKLRIRIAVPEVDALQVNPGDQIQLRLPSFPKEAPIVVQVARRTSSLDPSSRTMLVEAELDNTEGKLLPGMFGEASIRMSADVATNMLPARAIRFDENGSAYVYVLNQDDTVNVTEIETGFDDGNLIEILSGLAPGQSVIGPHLKRFTDGQKVRRL